LRASDVAEVAEQLREREQRREETSMGRLLVALDGFLSIDLEAHTVLVTEANQPGGGGVFGLHAVPPNRELEGGETTERWSNPKPAIRVV